MFLTGRFGLGTFSIAKPKKLPSLTIRDTYGFEVKKEHEHLYNEYQDVREDEEEERIEKWEEFLDQLGALMNVKIDSDTILDGLLRMILRSPHEYEDHLIQLESLVYFGLPMNKRGRLWILMMNIDKKLEENKYEELVMQSIHGLIKTETGSSYKSQEQDMNFTIGTFQPDIQMEDDLPPKAVERPKIDRKKDALANALPFLDSGFQDWIGQIEKDLHRTFPNNPLMDDDGISALKRMLSAYSVKNTDIGYCQGMNFIAGCLLLFLEEEEAFWALCIIVEDLLPGYFEEGMFMPQVDQLVFKHLMEEKFPELARFMYDHGVDASTICTQWFLCCFVHMLPLETCLRVWDILFYEHSPSIFFRVSLALVHLNTQSLTDSRDSVDLWTHLQNMPKACYDGSTLIDVASYEYGDVDPEMIENLRSHYKDRIDRGERTQLMLNPVLLAYDEKKNKSRLSVEGIPSLGQYLMEEEYNNQRIEVNMYDEAVVDTKAFRSPSFKRQCPSRLSRSSTDEPNFVYWDSTPPLSHKATASSTEFTDIVAADIDVSCKLSQLNIPLEAQKSKVCALMNELQITKLKSYDSDDPNSSNNSSLQRSQQDLSKSNSVGKTEQLSDSEKHTSDDQAL